MKPMISVLAGCLAVAMLAGQARAGDEPRSKPARMVLVELFTSQGCDMCPEAERLLGALALQNRNVVPLALHVDYFNDPWKDPFSDKLHSQRQASYNEIYRGPKNAQYGLYYTPMVMVDGTLPVNGRDARGIQNAVKQAARRSPQVSLAATLGPGAEDRKRDLRLRVSALTPELSGREVLVCAVLRDDLVVTQVPSGENAGKALTARFPARSTQFELVRLDGKKESRLHFPFQLQPAWNAKNLGIVVFVQDREAGTVYQSALVSWVEPEGVRAGGRETGAHRQ